MKYYFRLRQMPVPMAVTPIVSKAASGSPAVSCTTEYNPYAPLHGNAVPGPTTSTINATFVDGVGGPVGVVGPVGVGGDVGVGEGEGEGEGKGEGEGIHSVWQIHMCLSVFIGGSECEGGGSFSIFPLDSRDTLNSNPGRETVVVSTIYFCTNTRVVSGSSGFFTTMVTVSGSLASMYGATTSSFVSSKETPLSAASMGARFRDHFDAGRIGHATCGHGGS
jgi:hypothetical protein